MKRFTSAILLAGLVLVPAVEAQAAGCAVLLIWDTPGGGTPALQNAVSAAGHSVTLSSTSETGYTGSNPAPSAFDAVIHLNGQTFGTPMPVAGQSALTSYVQSGGSYIGTEYNSYEFGTGTISAMSELVLLNFQASSFGTTTWSPESSQAGHPILAGISAPINIDNGGANAGSLRALTPAPVALMTNPNAYNFPSLAVRDYGTGKVVHIGTAGNYSGGMPLADPDLQKLFVNSVNFACANAPLRSYFITGPALVTNAVDATFTFAANKDGATFTCALDGAAYTACTSPATYTGLFDGTHLFRVRARVGAANEADPPIYSWRIDTSPPDTTITNGPAARTNQTNVSVSFGSPEAGSTFLCSLDGAASFACSSPRFFFASTEGTHTATITARDIAGNLDPTPATRTWVSDFTRPITTLLTPIPARTNQDTLTFEFAADEAATFQCLADGQSIPCLSPVEHTFVGESNHNFQVRATDVAGNVGFYAAKGWFLDLTAPQTAFTRTPAAISEVGDSLFEFQTNEQSEMACSLDGAELTPCTSPVRYALDEGPHEFTIVATDVAGNTQAEPTTHSWIVDLNAPEVDITSPRSGGTYVGSTALLPTSGAAATIVAPGTFELTADVTDATPVTVEFSVDGTVLCALSEGPYRCDWTPEPGSGEHVIRVTATDTLHRRTRAEVRALVY